MNWDILKLLMYIEMLYNLFFIFYYFKKANDINAMEMIQNENIKKQ